MPPETGTPRGGCQGTVRTVRVQAAAVPFAHDALGREGEGGSTLDRKWIFRDDGQLYFGAITTADNPRTDDRTFSRPR